MMFAKLIPPLVLLGWCPLALAANYTVTSLSELQTRIDAAQPGDTLTVANGVYTASSTLAISVAGTAAAPITITAETIGGVEIRGSRNFSFNRPAAYVTVRGFKFTTSASISIASGTSHCRLSRNTIELTIAKGSDVSYVNISGDDVEIDRNEMRNKSTLGEMLDIAGSGSQVARRLWVHHNYFHDFTSPGGNGAETIRWGLSGLSLSNGEGVCEFNLFVRCMGENEMISNKSSGNIYRYNTVLDSPGGEISQRHGNDCRYYGNYMRNTQGIRVYGDRHYIFSNYLEGNSSGINMGNGDGDVYNGAALTAHDRPDDNVVVFNTLINNSTPYEMGGRTGGLGATNTTFANNLIVGGDQAVLISTTAPYTNPVWSGNLVWNTEPGSLPASGFTSVDPRLARDADGIYHLQAGSPAIAAAAGQFSWATVDQDGQSRSGAKDIGADEFSSAPIVARILTPADVGPFSSDTPTSPAVVANPPANITIAAGDLVVFSITATGGALTYQWRHDSAALTGANAASLVFRATTADAGLYTCVVTNSAGTATSTAARLDVVDPAAISRSRIVNLAIRSTAGTGAETLIVGAVIGGGDAGATKPVLLRAVGPTLAAFGVDGVLPDPMLTLFSGETALATNDDWNNDAQIAAIAKQVGAFDLSAVKDAALYRAALATGNYTVKIAAAEKSGSSSSTGVALAEVYDAGTNTSGSASAQLRNVSARTKVGTGSSVLIAGFVIRGDTAKTVLIRGIGPTLGAFGVPGALADPLLELFQGDSKLAENNDWAGTTALSDAFNAVGAFGLSATSSDAALLVTLAPGLYSAKVSGVSGTTGIALAEVYELP